MKRIIVTGATGRMGSRIIALLKEYPDLHLAGALEKKGSKDVGRDIGLLLGAGETGVQLSDDLENIIAEGDIIIDFTVPGATMQHAKTAAENVKAMVIGTTGFSKDQIGVLRRLSGEIPVLLAPNMSVGVNLLFKILRDVAPVLGDDYDIEIIEAHHRMKKDAPSGT
ncbi:MAG TPA: 4-hydroxy-tetrahydrodipicolinate reductase, partial [Dissulfurispiraceae bacterium]|nr:4-hydroxy-tetrahydrodipicolinate reductase [Dissulfurispiraceae bacterium]